MYLRLRTAWARCQLDFVPTAAIVRVLPGSEPLAAVGQFNLHCYEHPALRRQADAVNCVPRSDIEAKVFVLRRDSVCLHSNRSLYIATNPAVPKSVRPFEQPETGTFVFISQEQPAVFC